MKTINENGTFRKRCFHVYVWTDENVGFRIRWCNTSFTTIITHTLWGMLSYFHCSAFSHGRAKTIRIRYVWTRFFGKRREKNLRFQTKTYTCGRGLSLLGNGNGKAINSTISVRTRAQSLLFSSNPNSLQSTGPLGKSQKKWNNEKSIFSATFSWTSLLSDRKVPKISLGRSEFLKKISSLSWDKW